MEDISYLACAKQLRNGKVSVAKACAIVPQDALVVSNCVSGWGFKLGKALFLADVRWHVL